MDDAVLRKEPLRYVEDAGAGIRRRRRGKGFSYLHPNGRAVRDAQVLARIRALAIPPAWDDVWICADPDGHIQATGRDALGRKQYRYHEGWSRIRGEAKFAGQLQFAEALPRLRRRVARDLRRTDMDRLRVTAVAMRLLDATHIRVGNREYARRNGSRGLTTLQDQNLQVRGDRFALRFRAKGGQRRRVEIHDPALARLMRRCRDMPGEELFRYRDDSGELATLTATDVNGYIREAMGGDFTAKDFRTWAGTVVAVAALQPYAREGRHSRRALNAAIDTVAEHLGNTRTVCRKYYIHPAVIEAFLDRRLAQALDQLDPGCAPARLRADERRTYALLASLVS